MSPKSKSNVNNLSSTMHMPYILVTLHEVYITLKNLPYVLLVLDIIRTRITQWIYTFAEGTVLSTPYFVGKV